MEEHPEVSDGHFQDLTDFGGFQGFDFAEGEGGALCGREALQAGGDESSGLFGEEETLEIGWGRGPVAGGIEAGFEDVVDGFVTAVGGVGAAAFEGFAVEDGGKPGAELGAALEGVHLFEEGDEDVLDEVFGFGGREAEGAGGAEERAGMSGDGFGEGVGIAEAEAIEEGAGFGSVRRHVVGCGGRDYSIAGGAGGRKEFCTGGVRSGDGFAQTR